MGETPGARRKGQAWGFFTFLMRTGTIEGQYIRKRGEFYESENRIFLYGVWK